jgi:hypothetical protein
MRQVNISAADMVHAAAARVLVLGPAGPSTTAAGPPNVRWRTAVQHGVAKTFHTCAQARSKSSSFGVTRACLSATSLRVALCLTLYTIGGQWWARAG